jgi:hypothetical protein
MNVGNLTLEEAELLVETALAEGAKLGKAFSVAVVDSGGFMLLVKRSDGARPLTPSIAAEQGAHGSRDAETDEDVAAAGPTATPPSSRSSPTCPTTRSSRPKAA